MNNQKTNEITVKTIGEKVDQAILSLLSTKGPSPTVDRSADYSRSKTLFQLGLDQIEQLQLRSLLSNAFSFEIYPTFFQQYPTPESIIQFLVETKLRAFKDWIYEIEWRSTPVPEMQELTIDQPWIIFCDEEDEFASQLKAILHEHRQQCVIVYPGKKFLQKGSEHFIVNPHSAEDFKQLISKIPTISKLAGAVYLWGYEQQEKCLDHLHEYHKKSISGLVSLSNQLATMDHSNPIKLWVVTQSLITDGNGESLANWPLNGLCKIIREEYPDLHCTFLALDSKISVIEACDTLFCELTAASGEPDIAYQGGNRLVARMMRGSIEAIRLPNFSSDKTYLIAGGLGAWGILIAKWYISLGAKYLVLLDEGEVTPEIQIELDNFENQGVEVAVFSAKFDDATALQKIFHHIRNDLPPLRGLINSAGIVDNDLLMNMNWDRFEDIYRLKVSGNWNLHQLTESLDLDHFILFSSCLPDLAPLAKANHAVGNSFLDALSHYRRKRGLHSLTFDWGPRDLRHVEVRHTFLNDLKNIEPILADQSFRVLEQMFYFDKSQITVCKIKWAELFQSYTWENPLFDDIAIELGFKRADILAAYIKAPTAKRMEILQAYIHEQVRIVLKLRSSHQIEIRRDFKKMGMDNFGMKTLRNRIQADFHEAAILPFNFIEAHPTIEELAIAVARLLKKEIEPLAKMATMKVEVDLHEPVAIIGMSCRFPGNVTTPDHFWTMLRAGVDTIIEDKEIKKFGGFVEELNGYESSFFGVKHHHLSLELALEALEYAGIPSEKIKESKTGVFIAITGESGVVSKEISNYFELSGPAMAIDAGAASSIASVELACEKLRLGLIDLAFAGGINVLDRKDGVQPSDGKCRSLDASANGNVMSEGGGLILLKRAADAERDKDNILAIVKGVSVNREGAILAALTNGKVKPNEIQYIETEGSGYIIDDSMEVNSFSSVYGEDRSKRNPLYMGSVKANIGNAGAASGIAGIIKCVMAMKNKEIPPQINFKELNPLIEEGRSYITVATTIEPWHSKEETRHAAVNSFCLNGTNAHLILQQAPKRVEKIGAEKPYYLVTLSAKTPEELEELIKRFQVFIAKSTTKLAEIAYTSNAGRDHLDYRAAVIAKDLKELKSKINKNDLLRGKREKEKNFQIPTGIQTEWKAFLELTAQEYVSGAKIEWDQYYNGNPPVKIVLPTYPFTIKGKEKPIERIPQSFSDVLKKEISIEILNDNIAIIQGDRESERDLIKLKELKDNPHIHLVILVYPSKS